MARHAAEATTNKTQTADQTTSSTTKGQAGDESYSANDASADAHEGYYCHPSTVVRAVLIFSHGAGIDEDEGYA